MTALTWPEIKRRLKELRKHIEVDRRDWERLGDEYNVAEFARWLAALDAVLSIEALDPKEPMG